MTAAGAGIYNAVVEHDGISGLDQPAQDQCIAYRTSTNTQLLTAFTHLGGPIGMTIIASVITIALVWRSLLPSSSTPVFEFRLQHPNRVCSSKEHTVEAESTQGIADM